MSRVKLTLCTWAPFPGMLWLLQPRHTLILYERVSFVLKHAKQLQWYPTPACGDSHVCRSMSYRKISVLFVCFLKSPLICPVAQCWYVSGQERWCSRVGDELGQDWWSPSLPDFMLCVRLKSPVQRCTSKMEETYCRSCVFTWREEVECPLPQRRIAAVATLALDRAAQ